jgi:mannose-1-phosphate guanylyltransferase/mannose-6-phosphate isomerase
MKIVPVILSGGSGERLWPLSRRQLPKQYLPLATDKTMLQETILRLNGLPNVSDPIIICNSDHRFLVAEQCQELNIKNLTILLEPIGRNTAPAIAAAAFQSKLQNKDAVLLILSADHVIGDKEAFHQSINIAYEQAIKGKLVTFGIVPTDANTGYGYIETANKDSSSSVRNVERFIEKPNQALADSFVNLGNYFWNSGMFLFEVNTLISELKLYCNDVLETITLAVNYAQKDLDFIRLDKKAFELAPNISIDYALMEKSSNVVVVPTNAKWNDIGSWLALYDIGKKDIEGNVTTGDVVLMDSTNCYINANHHLVVAVGVNNLIVVDTSDATFIASQNSLDKVKTIVNSLKDKSRNEGIENRKVYRPWGWYDTIETGDNFQVKKLHVKPKAKLSLQMHHYRAEHWVIVSGTATVINSEDKFTLKKGDSTFIPSGTVHGLENNTNKLLELIEVQSGSYLGEDDIVRYKDIYGRIK